MTPQSADFRESHFNNWCLGLRAKYSPVPSSPGSQSQHLRLQLLPFAPLPAVHVLLTSEPSTIPLSTVHGTASLSLPTAFTLDPDHLPALRLQPIPPGHWASFLSAATAWRSLPSVPIPWPHLSGRGRNAVPSFYPVLLEGDLTSLS